MKWWHAELSRKNTLKDCYSRSWTLQALWVGQKKLFVVYREREGYHFIFRTISQTNVKNYCSHYTGQKNTISTIKYSFIISSHNRSLNFYFIRKGSSLHDRDDAKRASVLFYSLFVRTGFRWSFIIPRRINFTLVHTNN